MIIGKNTETNENVKIDLPKLISTRLLIQANSGGGKSWLIRRLLEQSHGQVQQIVIDLEGEFPTLVDKYDYLLVGTEGEIPANVQTAELLARKLLELNVSTIIDLSELKHHERILFVKRFLDSLINAPRKLWHPCLVIVDEAHQFCPEKVKSESTSSVIDLLTRGRKRGFCGVLATQRIAKLNKDAAAECTNGFVGRTVLDIDRKRASYDLGFTTKEQELGLKKLDDGVFFGYGPAISKEDYVQLKVGGINTVHPEAGKNIIKSSKTPESIKKILKDVIDLPKEVEEEIKTKQGMQKRISELKVKLRVAENSQKVQEKIQEKIINVTDEKALQKAKDEGFKEAERFYKLYITPIEQNTKVLRNSILKLVNNAQGLLESKAFVMVGDLKSPEVSPVNVQSKIKREVNKFKPVTQVTPQVKPSITPLNNYGEETRLKTGAIRMLKAIAMFSELTRAKTKTMSGISSQGTFSTYIQDLKRSGCIIEENGLLKVTEEGINRVGDIPEMPTDTESLINLWSKHIKSGAIRMLRITVERYPNTISRMELQEGSGISSQGTFSTYIQDLKRNGLIKLEGSEVRCSEELFE